MKKFEHFVYAQVDVPEALQLKRQILESDINTINILQSIEALKQIRKEKSKLQSDIKHDLKELKSLMSDLDTLLPRPEAVKVKRKPKKRVKMKKKLKKQVKKQKQEKQEKKEGEGVSKKTLKLREELETIRRRLEVLG